MPVHALASMTWTELRDLPRRAMVAILPMGALEAHGPHLPLATDIIIADAMARAGAARLSARGFEVVCLPAVPFAPAPFAAAFPGTIHVSSKATQLVIAGVVHSLAEHGIRVIAIANAHHDPAHVDAIRAAVADMSSEGQTIVVFPDLTRRRWAERLTDEFRSGACHAGRYESSIVMAAQPNEVRADLLQTLPPNPRSLVRAIRSGQQTFAEAGGGHAYFGAPHEATVEEGREIIDVLGAIIEEAVLDALPGDMR